MNRELVTKNIKSAQTSKIKKEIINIWQPISELNVIINHLRSSGAHVMAARLAVQVEALEIIQAEGIRKFIGMN